MNDPATFYSGDLATIHSEGFASSWDAAAPFIAKLARAPGQGCLVVDLGCGGGRMLDLLRQQGVPGWGCDISAAFVALARARGLQVEQCDAALAPIPSSSLVIALGEVLAYADEQGNTALAAVAAKAADRLVPGGHLLFDLIGPSVAEGQAWRQGTGWCVGQQDQRRRGHAAAADRDLHRRRCRVAPQHRAPPAACGRSRRGREVAPGPGV